jgi:hypothetical protein
MNYSTLNANLSNKGGSVGGPTAPKTISITYNKSSQKPERIPSAPSNASTNNVPNTLVLRDCNGASKFTSLAVTAGLTVLGASKLNGTIDTGFGTGVVCSSSDGLLSSRLITSGDIANGTISTIDIKNDAVTSDKLAPDLRLTGAPTCLTTTNCSEANIANVGYVNRYVNAYVNKKLKCSKCRRHTHHTHHEEGVTDNNDDSDSDVDEFDPTIFHVVLSNYVVIFNYGTYIIENPSVIINMPRKKREGYFVKIVNKSGATITVNSDLDRMMYNAMYAFDGTTSQLLSDNKCMILTIVYKKGGNRSWSFEYF